MAMSRKPPQNQIEVDYGRLERLLETPGLSHSSNQRSTDTAHEHFIAEITKLFGPKKHDSNPQSVKRFNKFIKQEQKRLEENDAASATLNSLAATVPYNFSTKEKCPIQAQLAIDQHSHSSNQQLSKPLEEQQINQNSFTANCEMLTKLLDKRPHERNATTNEKIFSILSLHTALSAQLNPSILKELSIGAQLVQFETPAGITRQGSDIPGTATVMGSQGFYVILRGGMSPVHVPYRKHLHEDDSEVKERNCKSTVELKVGDWFGAVDGEQVEQPATEGLSMDEQKALQDEYVEKLRATKKYLCKVLEPDTVLVWLSSLCYRKAEQTMSNKELQRKINVLVACDSYSAWSRQSILKLAPLIKWRTFPPNTVLFMEGYPAPFVCYLLGGEVNLTRSVKVKEPKLKSKNQLDVADDAGPSPKEKHRAKKAESTVNPMVVRTKQVVIASAGRGTSFGEAANSKAGTTMPYTVVTSPTAGPVKAAVVLPGDVATSLDRTTRQLLWQTNADFGAARFGSWTDDEIHQEFLRQEKEKSWRETKHQVLLDSIARSGIKPGIGKWAKNVNSSNS